MKLIDTYKSILRYSGCQDIDGRIHAKLNDSDESAPLDIQGRPWVLPTEENLKRAYSDNLAIFHPLSENLLKGESNDVKRLKSCISIRLNYTLYQLFNNLLRLATDASLHKRFNPRQNELCVALKTIKDDQAKKFMELGLDVLAKRDLYGFVFINLKRAGTIEGVKYSRTGNISFPFYEKLKAGEDINDKKIKNNDRELYIRLCEYVFPEIQEPQKYSFGSNANTAPFLEALLRSSYNVVERIAEIYDTFEEFLDTPAIYEFDINWLDPFQDLPGYEKEIRTVLVTQSSNEVSSTTTEQPAQVAITNSGNGVSPANLFQSLGQRYPQQTNMFLQQPMLGYPQQMPQQMPYQQVPSWAIGKQVNTYQQQQPMIGYQQQAIPGFYTAQQQNFQGGMMQQPMVQQPMYPQYQNAYSNPYGTPQTVTPAPIQQQLPQSVNLSNITAAR